MADLNAQINEARQHGYSDEDILSYLGNSRSDLAPKIKEAQTHGYAPSDIVGYLGSNPPSQPSPLSKAAGAFWEGIGGKAALDILGGASRDPARAQKAAETVKALTAGIAAEPGRIWDELSSTGQAMLKGDLSGTAYHLAGSVPIFGAPAQQVANEVQQGKYAEAAGHTAALFAPFAAHEAAPVVAGTVAPRVSSALESAAQATAKTRAAVGGGLRAAGAALPQALSEGAEAAVMGGLTGGPHGAVLGFKLGTGKALGKAAVKGAQEAVAATVPPTALESSLASAQEILGTSLDEFAQSVADKPYAKLDAATQAKVVDFYQKAAAARQAYMAKTQPAPAAAPPVTPEAAPAELIPESRRLPAGPPLFEMPPATDTSYVRAVPAEYPEVVRQPVVTPEPAPATTPALQLRDAIQKMAERKTAESAPPAPAAMPPQSAGMAPAQAEAVFQQQKARIQEGMTPPPEQPPPAPAAAGGPSLLPLPEDVPPHYQALQQLEGTSAATRTFLKDRRIADYLLNKGVTPEQWEAMPLEDQNRLITQAPSASAKGKHRPFVAKPEGSAPRAVGRWAEEGVKDIADTMRWMQEQAKINAATQR